MPWGRTAVTFGTALVLALAYAASDAVAPASPVSAASFSGEAARNDQVRKSSVVRTRPTRYGIAFFGDSVSVGFGASDRGSGYIEHVSRWLQTRGKRVVETVHAKGGVPVAYWTDVTMPTRLDAAVIELGTNDVRLGTPSARFAQEYRTLARRIRAVNPRAQLLCLSVWPHREASVLDGVINRQIRAVCPDTYVDITRFRARPNIRSSDGFHPNDVGYRLIAEAVRSKLKPS